jgi:hypothetical protein
MGSNGERHRKMDGRPSAIPPEEGREREIGSFVGGGDREFTPIPNFISIEDITEGDRE